MTIIAAIATDTHVVMGSDIAVDYCGTVIHKAASKVFAVTTVDGERVLFGVAGNGGLGSAIKRSLAIDGTPDPDDHEAADNWASTVTEAITGICDSTTPRLTTAVDGSSDTLDGAMLMAWRQHLWYVFTHTAFRPNDGVAAVGSGDEAARGSMYTSLSHGADAYTAVHDAVKWASNINIGCRLDDRGPLVSATVDGWHEADSAIPSGASAERVTQTRDGFKIEGAPTQGRNLNAWHREEGCA
ncbi:hypothetical protein A6F59_16715 [Prescottella equi]|nr:hypothetical protein A6F59_16715 [Prescottella equi]